MLSSDSATRVRTCIFCNLNLAKSLVPYKYTSRAIDESTGAWVQAVVNRAADYSMQASFEEVKALPHLSSQREVSIHT